ncbi:ferric reductase like transmembrane component-domain-containing protein [Aspergillus recurvatus]
MGVDLLPPGQERQRHVYPPMNVALATPLFALAGGFLVLFVARFAIRIGHRLRLRAILNSNDQTKFIHRNGLIAWMNRHVFYAPLFGTRHSREFRIGRAHMGTVPLRIETVILALYIAINLSFFVCLVDWWEGYQEKLYQVKYAGGHLAVMNTPGLVLAAARNNPLIPLLGISFDTFNIFHRWVGRIIVVGAIVHMAAVIAGQIAERGFETTTHIIWEIPFFIWGMIALFGFTLIAIQSVSPLRHAFYEVFLHLHVALAVTSFIGLWYHLSGLNQQNVLLGTIILWGLERATRFASLVWRNIGKQRTVADFELLPGNVTRATVALARTGKFRAGQHMYLYVPSVGLWTSHPFSIAWTSTEETSADGYSNDSFKMLLDKKPQTTVSFLIKGQNGFTRELQHKASNSETRQFRATVFAEGPYGMSTSGAPNHSYLTRTGGLEDLNTYGTVMLIASGVGITNSMSYLYQFLEGFSARETAVRRVNLIWVTRCIDDLHWIDPWMKYVFAHPAIATKEFFQPSRLAVSVQVYITRKEAGESSVGDSKSVWAFSAPSGVLVSVGFGRPCFGVIIEREMETQVGAMAVSVCGNGCVTDDVRQAVREVQKGGRTISLHEEAFCW